MRRAAAPSFCSSSCSRLAARCLPAAAHARPTCPSGQDALRRTGPDGRCLIDGQWLLRLDPADGPRSAPLRAARRPTGWTPTTRAERLERRGRLQRHDRGSVAWYRKDFRLPDRSARASWIARFESVNYRASVWLNGRKLGRSRGGYMPFDARA